MKVYAVQYCPCIYEEGYETKSLHLSKEEAVKTISTNRKKEFDQIIEGVHFMNSFEEERECQRWKRITELSGIDMTSHRIKIMEVKE